MKKPLFTPLVLLVLFAGCQVAPSNEAQAQKQEKPSVISSEAAGKLLSTTCYACHNPNVESHDNMLAPPLAGIKGQYLNKTSGKEAFIEQMAAFVYEPNEETAIMKGPVRRFGLMPKTALSKEEVTAIVTYIYENDIPEPAWYAEHHEKMHGGQGKHGKGKQGKGMNE